MNKEQRKALATLIEYNWSDELTDYIEHPGEDDTHIFPILVLLDNWLRGVNIQATEYRPKLKRREARGNLCNNIE